MEDKPPDEPTEETSLVVTSPEPNASELLALLNAGIHAFERGQLTREKEIALEHTKVERNFELGTLSIEARKHAIDKYYEMEWRRFKISIGLVASLVGAVLVIASVLMFGLKDVERGYGLLLQSLLVLLGVLGGGGLLSLFRSQRQDVPDKPERP